MNCQTAVVVVLLSVSFRCVIPLCCFKLAHNGLQLGEVAGFEALSFILAPMFI
jgi:hypothetical protein